MSILQGLMRKIGIHNTTGQRQALRVFLLDDDMMRHEWFAKRFKHDEFHAATNPADAIRMLRDETDAYDIIFLDHDLLPEHYHSEVQDDERTGYAVAAWLAANPREHASSTVVVHTRNADGAMRMVELLRQSGRQVEYVPFPILSPKIKNTWHR